MQHSQFFEKRKLKHRQKKDFSKTPNFATGQSGPEKIQTLLIKEQSVSRSTSRNQKAVLPQNVANNDATDTSFDL